MNKEKKLARSGVDRVFNVQLLDGYFLHSEYSILINKTENISETGLMKVFELISVNAKKPKFIGRWDEKQNVLDVDVYNVDSLTKKHFLKEKKGYKGHHSVLSKPEHRTCRINIEILGEVFFCGEIFFNTNITIKLETGYYRMT